jgi:hypothetical protein
LLPAHFAAPYLLSFFASAWQIFSNSEKWEKLEKMDDLIFKIRNRWGYDCIVDPFEFKIKDTKYAFSILKYFSDGDE